MIKKIIYNKKLRFFLILVIIVLLLITLKVTNTKQSNTVPETIPTPLPQKIITNTPTPALIEGRGNPDFYEEQRPKILEQYPLFDFIPYRTDKYIIDYTKPLVLQVVLKKDTLEIRQEVFDWIISKGVDPKTHIITWKIQ